MSSDTHHDLNGLFINPSNITGYRTVSFVMKYHIVVLWVYNVWYTALGVGYLLWRLGPNSP